MNTAQLLELYDNNTKTLQDGSVVCGLALYSDDSTTVELSYCKSKSFFKRDILENPIWTFSPTLVGDWGAMVKKSMGNLFLPFQKIPQ